MILNVFAVYDSKAGYYSRPFMFQSRGEAIRAFTESANDASHQFCKYAADFTLFQVGTYDDQTGLHECVQEVMANLGKAIEYKEATKEPPELKEVI